MMEQIEKLTQYAEADRNERLHLFLQFPDLRDVFQQIERKDLTAQMGFGSLGKQHNIEKCSPFLSLLKGVYRRIVERKTLPKCLRLSQHETG
jgi:hypothetical protein